MRYPMRHAFGADGSQFYCPPGYQYVARQKTSLHPGMATSSSTSNVPGATTAASSREVESFWCGIDGVEQQQFIPHLRGRAMRRWPAFVERPRDFKAEDQACGEALELMTCKDADVGRSTNHGSGTRTRSRGGGGICGGAANVTKSSPQVCYPIPMDAASRMRDDLQRTLTRMFGSMPKELA
ncbi:unnamed protein product, partial [Amoebophrya sp. A25]|eukprot:GSA25T00014375001.1